METENQDGDGGGVLGVSIDKKSEIYPVRLLARSRCLVAVSPFSLQCLAHLDHP